MLLVCAFVCLWSGANGFVVPRTALVARPMSLSQQDVFRQAPHFLSSSDGSEGGESSKLPMLLDPGTKGGALFLSLVLFIIPLVGYQIVTAVFDVDPLEAGKWIGVGFTFATLVLWVSTYIFRVATKDMTYVS